VLESKRVPLIACSTGNWAKSPNGQISKLNKSNKKNIQNVENGNQTGKLNVPFTVRLVK